MSKFIDAFDKAVEDGVAMRNMGLRIGLPRLESIFPGIMRGTYYLIGAPSGCGKTAFVDDKFVYNVYKYYKMCKENKYNVKIKIRYNSYEIDKVRKIAKLVARYIFETKGILLDLNYILGKTTDIKKIMSEEILKIVKEAKESFRELEEILDIYDIKENPTGIYKSIKEEMKEFGEVIGTGADRYFRPFNPNYYYINIIDHASLVKQESHVDLSTGLKRLLNKKETIDKYSEYSVENRNLYGTTEVVIQQFNRSLESAYRGKFQNLEPTQSDFKDTGNTYEDCDIALGMFNPNMFSLDEYEGYNIRKLGKRFIGLSVIKNRDGESDVKVGLNFIGEVGIFNEMPKPNNLPKIKELYDYLDTLNSKRFDGIAIQSS